MLSHKAHRKQTVDILLTIIDGSKRQDTLDKSHLSEALKDRLLFVSHDQR